jgi:tetratricopeptide (TPR) repeat protein
MCFAAVAAAQNARVDSLTILADSMYGLGKYEDACRVYEEALTFNEHGRNALIGRGKALLVLDQWSDAEDCFTKVLASDTADLAAHYYEGIALRETGKTKAWLLRNMDWNEARDHFFWVMRRDSTFGDVLYEYARLLDYRKDYPQAIAAGHQQLALRPDLPSVRVGLFRLYRSFVTNDRQNAIGWLQKEATPIAFYFLAEALRRENRLDEAEKLLNDLLAGNALPLTQAMHLSLARINAKRGNIAGAESRFWTAVNEVYTHLGADLIFEDLKYLVTDRELELYKGLESPAKKIVFFRAFWDSRNPAATSQSNVRIGEHYRRLVYAEDSFEYTGFRTAFNNPDRYKELAFPKSYSLNEEFNDEGLIYIRHGEPGHTQRSMQSADQAESWLYDATEETPRRIFHFQKKNASGNNWRLIPYPEDIVMLQSLLTWDVRYLDLLRGNASAEARVRDELREESRETVSQALATEEHSWKKEVTTFEFPFSIDAFRGQGSKALIDISYAVPLARFAAGSAAPGDPHKAEVGLSIRRRDGEIALASLDTIVIPPGRSEKDTYANRYRFLIPPDTYAFAMHVRPLEGNSFGNWKAQKLIPRPTQELALSDIQYLLPSNIKSTLEIEGVKVVPSPFRAYPVDRPLYTYFHVYDLVKDADGKTLYRVRYLLTPVEEGKPLPVVDPDGSAGKTKLILERTREGTEDSAAEFGTLDLSEVSAGRYILTVAVTDRKRVQTVMVQRELDVFEP